MSTLTALFFIPSLGIPELLVVLLIVVIIFGAKKLPLLGKGFGEGIRNFKKGLKSEDAAQVLEEGPEAKEKHPSSDNAV